MNKSLRMLFKVMGACRNKDKSLTVEQLQTLLLIAENPGITQKSIVATLGTTPSSTHRHIARLGQPSAEVNGHNLGLIEGRPHPEHGGWSALFLTHDGEAFLRGLTHVIEGSTA